MGVWVGCGCVLFLFVLQVGEIGERGSWGSEGLSSFKGCLN